MKFINFGLEAIAFQSPEFANKMEYLISKVMGERKAQDAQNCSYNKELIKLIKDTTGFEFKIIFNTTYYPCTLPFHINPDSILGYATLKQYYAETSEETLKRLLKVKQTASIDLKNARVTGFFTEYEVPIYMNFNFLRKHKFSNREIVAILAHEIGHTFTSCEYAFRTVRTNQILSSVAKTHAGGDKDEYKYALKVTEEIFNLKTGILDDLVEVKNQEVVLTAVIGTIEKNTYEQSIMGNTTYDITTFEAMSDNYATRLGLGRELVTGLEKILIATGAPEYSQDLRRTIFYIDCFCLLNIILGVVAAIQGWPVILSGYYIFMGVLLVWGRLKGRDHRNIYDDVKVRYKRIKEQLIHYLKNVELPKEDIQRTLESLKIIEKAIDQVSERKSFMEFLFSYLDPATIRFFSHVEIQKKLETLAANELYVKAAQLRTLD